MAMRADGENTYCFAGYTLDLKRGCLHDAEGEIELRPKSFELLHYLIENAGRLVSKEELIKAVWSRVVVTDESLTQCVSDVRRALGDGRQRLIKTLPRRGYMFIAPVSPAVTGQTAALPGIDRRTPPGHVAPRLSIVVLPFVSLDSDPDAEHFADGLTDDLRMELSRISGSFVIARGTASTYKGRKVDTKQIGRELGVRYLLEGSVRRDDNRVRVAAHLADTETGAQIWADRFDKHRTHLLEMQSEIVTRLARALRFRLIQAESRRVQREPRNDLDAVDLTMRAKALLQRPLSLETNASARKLFEQAVVVDERENRAWLGIAITHVIDVLHFVIDGAERHRKIELAHQALEQALSIDPSGASVHYVRGHLFLLHGMLSQAAASFEDAISRNASYADAYWALGSTKLKLRQPQEAITIADKGIAISPYDGNVWVAHRSAGAAAFVLGNEVLALIRLRHAWQQNRRIASVGCLFAAMAMQAGYANEARAALAEIKRLHPGYTIDQITETFLTAFLDSMSSARIKRLLERLRDLGLPDE
jgi:TolB-like protein